LGGEGSTVYKRVYPTEIKLFSSGEERKKLKATQGKVKRRTFKRGRGEERYVPDGFW